MKCYLCGKELTEENSSSEHIIPNALGGRLAAKILCKECNSDLGSSFDSSLTKSLEWFSCKVNHGRSRGTVQPVKVSIDGMDVFALPGGNYEGTQVEKVKDNHYQIHALGKNALFQAKKKAKEIILKSAKKYNWSEDKINEQLEKLNSNIENNIKQIEHPLVNFSLQFGGKEVLLSVLKTAINFAIMKNVPLNYLNDVITSLKEHNDNDFKLFVNSFYPENIYPENSIYHTLLLKGDPQTGILYCLLSFYGVFNAIVLLSSNYNGEHILHSYCYDIWNEKEVPFSVNPCLTKEEIAEALSISDISWQKIVKGIEEACGKFLNFFVSEKDFQNSFVQLVFDLIDKIAYFYPFLPEEPFLDCLEQAIIERKSVVLKNKFLKDKDINNILRGNNSDLFYNQYLNKKCMAEVLNLSTRIVLDKLFTPEKNNLFVSEHFIQYLSQYMEQYYKNSPLYSGMRKFLEDENIIISFLEMSVFPILKDYVSRLK